MESRPVLQCRICQIDDSALIDHIISAHARGVTDNGADCPDEEDQMDTKRDPVT